MQTLTYTETKTRTETVVDQFDMFLRYTGLRESARDKILKGIGQRWFSGIGVYLLNAGGLRILEAEVAVDWKLHSDLTLLSPTVRTDLPGWESGAAPEITVIGHRFGRIAREQGVEPRYWVRWTSELRANESHYLACCEEAGVTPGSGLPNWASSPSTLTYQVQDLNEVSAMIRKT
ncbi:hypothetical protein ACFYWY_03830 [Streptomyces sp. NPDC002870]|uniref:hypothetical protein n=1 Tax=Streptomyces sp. NPDC002870 TaxID=3364666 RepID=UPI0036A8D739